MKQRPGTVPADKVCSKPGHKGSDDKDSRSVKVPREVISRAKRGSGLGRCLARLGAAANAVPWGMVGLPVLHAEEETTEWTTDS